MFILTVALIVVLIVALIVALIVDSAVPIIWELINPRIDDEAANNAKLQAQIEAWGGIGGKIRYHGREMIITDDEDIGLETICLECEYIDDIGMLHRKNIFPYYWQFVEKA